MDLVYTVAALLAVWALWHWLAPKLGIRT